MSADRKRFCFVTTFYPPYNFGGDGIAVRRLAIALAERGHHVEVVHCIDAFQMLRPPEMPATGAYSDHPSIVHHGLHSAPRFLSPLITQQTARPGLKRNRLRSILQARPFDVVHFHNASLIGATAFGYTDAVTLYTMHEHWLVCPMHVLWRFNREPCPGRKCIRCQLRGGRPPQMWRYTGVLERSLREVDAIIAPSEFTREKHREFGLRTTTPIVHIPNFIPPPARRPDESVASHPRPYFLYVGRLERIKGAHTLVDTFTRYRNADLLIAGAGHDADTLRHAAATSPHIHFLGQMPYAALEQLMRDAIAVVVPSVGFEVFPTAVLEANAQATPVIGRRLGPMPEMLDGKGGLTYGDEPELVGALEALRSSPERRAELGARGRHEYDAHWTPERHLERYFALIDTLQSEKKPFASRS
jgi:glycosyltransferase involved in cell wall biosynthesis